MRNHRRHVLLAPVIVLVVTFAAPTVDAGGGVGIHLGSGGFGVSVGFGDWGVYTRSWSDPYWSIDFNATLAGYGEWVWVSGLGRVWRPWVAASWRPYTHGRWVSTGYGLTWVAYEPWGYVPHHYGSWAYASFGWVWVPGYSYSCANVVWVGSRGYVGWYARPPWGWSHAKHGFRHGYRHGFRDGYDSGYSDGWHDARYATYVDWKHFGSDNVSRHAVTHRIASQNHIEGRTVAPSRDEIRQRGGAIVTETRLSRRTVKVDGREITIARPEGVARSIERNAAETVGSSLSGEALERRQPLVRPRTARHAPPWRVHQDLPGVSRDARSPRVQPSTRESSASRSERSGIFARSTQVQPPKSASATNRTHARASDPPFSARQDRDDSRQTRPRDVRQTQSQRQRSIAETCRIDLIARDLQPQADRWRSNLSNRVRFAAVISSKRAVRDKFSGVPAELQAMPIHAPSKTDLPRRAKSRDSEEKNSEESCTKTKTLIHPPRGWGGPWPPCPFPTHPNQF